MRSSQTARWTSLSHDVTCVNCQYMCRAVNRFLVEVTSGGQLCDACGLARKQFISKCSRNLGAKGRAKMHTTLKMNPETGNVLHATCLQVYCRVMCCTVVNVVILRLTDYPCLSSRRPVHSMHQLLGQGQEQTQWLPSLDSQANGSRSACHTHA